MWPFGNPSADNRSGRLVFLIECLLNQNARDKGAAEAPAATREVVDALLFAEIGMVQIPCPETACLGFERCRTPGQTIREALQTPSSLNCCARLAAETAQRIQTYSNQGYEVVAILGGNEQSPGCAVHTDNTACAQASGSLAPGSGVFMEALARELQKRDLSIPFRGMRDADRDALVEDLAWLHKEIAVRR